MRLSRTILFPVLLFTWSGLTKASSSSSASGEAEKEGDVDNKSKEEAPDAIPEENEEVLKAAVQPPPADDDELEGPENNLSIEMDGEMFGGDMVTEQRFYDRKPKDRCEALIMRMGDYYRRPHENREWYNNGNSLPTVCKRSTDNPFGTYTSHKVPCTFKFHLVEDDEVLDGVYEMSDKCSSNNVAAGGVSGKVKELKDHVEGWPDECVGDVKRCYSLKYHDDVLWEHLCRRNWTIPEGTTHLSVTCQEDKRVKQAEIDETLKRMENSNKQNSGFNHKEHHQIMRKHAEAHHEFLLKALMIVFIGLTVLCLLCFVCVNRIFFQPYLRSLKKSKSDSELTSLVVDDDVETSRRKNVVK